jgi:hypothetical protein
MDSMEYAILGARDRRLGSSTVRGDPPSVRSLPKEPSMSTLWPEAVDPLVAGRRWSNRVQEFFDWSEDLFRRQPEHLLWQDAFNISAYTLIWLQAARHAEAGGLRPETLITASCATVMQLAGLPRERWEESEGWAIWGQYLDWYKMVWPETERRPTPRIATIKHEIDVAFETVLHGVLWDGDLGKGYAEAAKLYARGGWRRIMRQADRFGITSGLSADTEGEVLAALEAIRISRRMPLSRTQDGRILPSFGAALDGFRKEVRAPQSGLPDGVTPNDLADVRASQEVGEIREAAELRAFVSGFPPRGGKSEYCRLVAVHAWDLLTGATNPERLASGFGLEPRVVRREWARHVARMEQDLRWGPLIRRRHGAA